MCMAVIFCVGKDFIAFKMWHQNEKKSAVKGSNPAHLISTTGG